ncbi:MAG TPA: DUF4623 domain-containing protein [Lacipirellulaceae bacterium]|jgi:hypothetical protein|nr:DUF4623 domain-containing protein [Lacipirellulaceae bacterium]
MRRNIVSILFLLCACALISSPVATAATVTLTKLASFGGGDGWLAPGEGGYTFLGTGNNERGLTYGNGHVYLVSRTGGTNVRILNSTTGADLGGLNVTGVSGGTFAISAAGVGADGTIYAANLTTQSTTTPFTVYKWTSEAAAPSVAYAGDGGLAGSRLGDDFAVTGSGSSTRFAAGYNSTPIVAGNNSYSIIDPAASTATAIAFTGTPPNAGDFRLGLTFVDATHVLGTAGSSLYRNTSYSGSAGTLINSPAIPDPSGATADRLLAYTTFGGSTLLAVQSIGDSHVTIYDASNPAAPVYLASGNNTSGSLTTNGNATGQIAWGDITNNADGSVSRTLYAMSTNQGIQAFVVTVPEPATLSMIGLLVAACGLMARRRVS